MKSRLQYQREKFKKRYHYNGEKGTIRIGKYELYVIIEGVYPPNKWVRCYKKRFPDECKSIGISSGPEFLYALTLPKAFFHEPQKGWDFIIYHEIGHMRLNMLLVCKDSWHAHELFSPNRYIKTIDWIFGAWWRTDPRSYKYWDSVKFHIKESWKSDQVELIREYERMLSHIWRLINMYGFRRADRVMHEVEPDVYAAMITGSFYQTARSRWTSVKHANKAQFHNKRKLNRLKKRCSILIDIERIIPIPDVVQNFFDHEKKELGL